MTNLQFIKLAGFYNGRHFAVAVIFFVLIFFTACSTKIQKSFLEQKFPQSDSKLAPVCNDYSNYAPDSLFPSHTPIRYVRINFHIMRDSAGTINFNEKLGVEFVHGLIADVNQHLSTNRKMSLPEGNSTPVLPMRYQFVLAPDPAIPGDDGIYFHYDNKFAYFNKKKNTYDTGMFEKYKVQAGNVLNIFMIEHHPDSIKSPTYKSSTDGIGLSDWIKVVGLYQHAYDTTRNTDGTITVTGPNYNSNLLQHETGHTLGLSHTWNTNDGCDDTPQNPGCWDQNTPPCKESGIFSNNMMDYNNCQCALTPCQLAKIHYNFSREKSSQRKLLLPVWCAYKPEASININWPQAVTWNSSKDFEGDIIIHNGGELTLQCEVALPKGARIIVKPKGKLILDGAKITNKCGDNWEGIEIWQAKKNKGEVVYLNPSVFEHVNRNPAIVPVSPAN